MSLLRAAPRPFLRQAQAPASQPLSLADVKQHLRVEHTEDDALIGRLIGAAVRKIDGKRGDLFHCLMAQDWFLYLDAFPWSARHFGHRCDGLTDAIPLPLGPVRSVASITYVDTRGENQSVSSGDFDFFAADGLDMAYVRPVYGTTWPEARFASRSVTIRYAAGYATAADVPDDIKAALLLHIGLLYDNRGESGDVALPMAYDALLRNYRRVSV